ncbi:MAG: MFS transporter [Chloroflexota bacterium]
MPAESPDATSRRPALPWGAVALGFASTFMVMGNRAAYAVIYPAIVADLDWSVAELTTGYSIGLFGYVPAVVVAGLLMDRIGVRITMICGAATVTLGMLLVSLSSTLPLMTVGFTLWGGLGTAFAGFVTVMKMLSIRAPERFAVAFGMAYVGQGVGSGLMSPIIQLAVDQYGWRVATAIASATGVGVLLMAARLAPGREVVHAHRHGPQSHQQSPSMRTWPFALLFLGNAMLGSQMLIPTHQVAHLLESGFAPIVAATAAGLWGAFSAVGGGAGGWILERLGSKRLLILAFAVTTVGQMAVMAAYPQAVVLVALYVLGSGLGRGLQSVALVSAQARVCSGPSSGKLLGVLDLGFGLGAFLGPWLTAIVHDRVESFNPGMTSGIVACGVVMISVLTANALAGARHR